MTYIGIDLAWADTVAANETGVVALDPDGRIVQAGWTVGVAETVAWVNAHASVDAHVFVDAPLVVLNPDGQRLCEKQVGQRYGSSKVSANSTNAASPRLAGVALRGQLEGSGWRYDDGSAGAPNVPDTHVSGHVILRQGSRGPVYYLKYRLPDGRQVKRRLGKAWMQRGRAPAGYYTARTADEALQTILADARRGTLPGMNTVNAKFADASAEWLRYVEHDRDVKPSTLSDYRHMVKRLDRTFGTTPIERIAAENIERWRAGLSCSNRTTQMYLIVLNGIFKRAMKVYKLPANPMSLVERPRVRQSSEIDVLSASEVRALVAATSTELHKALLLTAAFTGLRMGELLALRWGEVDFTAETIRVVRSFTIGGESSPKSGKPRSVPMVREVATALARIGQRERFIGEGDLVFAGAAGGHLDSKDVRAEYKAALDRAELRNLRFHDLRHTFGTRAVEQAESILELKEWMGHANVQTTMRYLHYKSKADAAQRLAAAFADEDTATHPALPATA